MEPLAAGLTGLAEVSDRRLERLLAPRRIAIVGASPRENTPGNGVIRMLLRGGFAGSLTAVNPNYREIEGIGCVPRLADLDAPPDLAVLAVRNERLEAALTDAAAAGAGAAVMFASGMLEEEAGGGGLIGRLRAIAAAHGMAVCGPNCMGFYNDLDRVWICGFPSPRRRDPGPIALVAHSGSVFGALMHNDERLRYALAVSPGVELTATVADYVRYALTRPEVKVIGLFLEAARDPEGFAAALAAAAQRDVPVVVLKIGRTEAAAAAALSHTGALAGSDLAYQALFDRHGVIRVDTLDEMAATLLLFAAGRRAAPGGLVAIHDSGGEREMTIDLADRVGVTFAAIGAATVETIAAQLDPGLAAENPLDAWGTAANYIPQFTACLNALLADEQAGLGLFCADLRDGYYLHRGFADAALAAAAQTAKPLAVSTAYTQLRHDGLALELTRAGVPVLDGTANALVAVRGALGYRDFQARAVQPAPTPPGPDAARARIRAMLAEAIEPDEALGLAALEAWGIPVPAHAIAGDEEQAVAAAQRIGFPVALKTASAGIAHKTERSGVLLGLADEAALRCGYRDFAARLGARVLIARMAPRGVELALGMVRDPGFGPVVTIGAGGTLIELLEDRRAALAPFDAGTAMRLIEGLRLRHLLDGYRGAPPVDLPRLAGIVAAFSAMAAELADLITEIDVNPLSAGPSSAETPILALDALLVPAPHEAL
ncbi:MAG: acetate--CoA ligase family protein [Acidisphaera sp.]|nr:acetate--CoA ligase family protein [Acidisphaera sp.]